MARKKKVVRFASSTKSASSVDPVSSGSSGDPVSPHNSTPSPISKNLTFSKTTPVTNGSTSKRCKPPNTSDEGRTATKRKSNPTIDPQHIMVTRSRQSRNDPSESPSPKRPRRGRTRDYGPVIYSGRWHPMDDILSPKRAAKVKARCGKPPDQSDTDDSGEEQESDTHDTEEDTEEGTEEENSEDQELSQASHHAPSPGCRRSSRKLSKKNVPNYDVRFHPTFDKALRPASARAALERNAKAHTSRRLSTETSITPSQNEGGTTNVKSKAIEKAPSTTASPAPKLSFSKVVSVSIPSVPCNSAVKSSPSPAKSTGKGPPKLPSPPPLSNLQNPHFGKISLEYNELGQFDQLIYSLQKGAPVYGNTLPLSWQTVKQTLFDCGEITFDELNSEEATRWLKLRYECLRLGIEAFFKSKPETADKNDWTLFRYEEFDAFDKNPGTKYWKHHRHSVFSPSPTTINVNQHEPMEIAETDDENEGRRGQEEATPYNQVNALEDRPAISTIDHSKLGDRITNNGGLEEASNQVGEEGSQEGKTPIIDLEDWQDEDTTLVETMHEEEVASSEGLMNHEELGKTIADFLDEPSSNRHVTKVTIPLPVKRPRKRKVAIEPEAEVEVHEDAPGGTPRIRHMIANNPPSPGTDLPKENLQDEAEHSSQVSVRTPQAPRFRWRTATTPFRSLFGGPPGPQSPST